MRGIILGIFSAVLVVSAALAQQKVKQPDQFTLTLSPQETEAMFAIISERPYKDVEPFLRKIREQVQQQIQAANAPTPKPEKPTDSNK